MNDPNADQFEQCRPLMFSIAYRMLGSATEAEDIVQEAYLRYQTAAPEQVTSHKAYLSKVVTNLCLNHPQSAHVQRETYIGPWLPEPVLTPSNKFFAPAQHADLNDSLSIAFLTLLEELTPLERAVFLLREVFDYEYAEIAQIIAKEETACRQLFSRAKKHIAERRPRFKPDQAAHRKILDQFIQATNTGDMDGLMQVLAEDVVLWSDGGGKISGAATRPIHGRDDVAQFVLASPRLAGDYRVELAQINDELAMTILTGGRVLAVLLITVDEGQVSEIRVMGNPEKLKWINANNDESTEVKQ